MPDNNTGSVKERTYDAIVIGSGASGGWAAKELCDKGLKTLILERGRDVKHAIDYPTASKAPYEFDPLRPKSVFVICAMASSPFCNKCTSVPTAAPFTNV